MHLLTSIYSFYSSKQKQFYPVMYSLVVRWKRKTFSYCASSLESFFISLYLHFTKEWRLKSQSVGHFEMWQYWLGLVRILFQSRDQKQKQNHTLMFISHWDNMTSYRENFIWKKNDLFDLIAAFSFIIKKKCTALVMITSLSCSCAYP